MMLVNKQGKMQRTGATTPGVMAAVLIAGGLAAGLMFAAPAQAEDAAAVFGTDRAVASTELAEVRGMENVFTGELNATLTNNDTTGDSGSRSNVVDIHAFDGASGVATVIQNAGDNVIIQTITQITVNYN